MLKFEVQNLTLNQYLASMNSNIDKIKCLGSTKLKEEESCCFVRFITLAHSINVVLCRGSRNRYKYFWSTAH